MPLWIIERDMAGWTDEELDAAGIQAKLCILWYPGMQWIRSYYHRETGLMTCLYEARSEDDIRRHAHGANLPCDAIRLVEEIDPALVEEPPAPREHSTA